MPAKDGVVVEVDGRRLSLSNLNKVLFPETGTTKGEVIHYYSTIAETMLPHLGTRPITRKRWPDGTQAHSFFHKDLEVSAPKWVPRWPIQHDGRTIRYPTADSPAVLVWLAQIAALELHVPQWFLLPDGTAANPDRIVFDLDPGPGAPLEQCAEVAFAVKDHLDAAGLASVPVTSGSKGIHLYSRIDGTRDSDEVSKWAHAVARAVQKRMPTLALSQMTKSLREGKVFIDWSQNNGAKTTISPYSLRGRESPAVAAPRTWDELAAPGLTHLLIDEVLERVASEGDLLDSLGPEMVVPGAASRSGSPSQQDQIKADPRAWSSTPSRPDKSATASAEGKRETAAPEDKLNTYRSMRDQRRTPEPVPEAPAPHRTGGDTFVIQQHHARALHWDFRLEHDGVLVSWAVPKGIPMDSGSNRLAVQTEDHPLEYASFEGTIPQGEYGAGDVTIWDAGTYELEKWRSDEVMFTLHGERSTGRYALIRTNGKNWLLHRTKEQPGGQTIHPAVRQPPAKPLREEILTPMLATSGDPANVGHFDADWSFENKWDGIRALAYLRSGTLTLYTRNGNDVTATYPELVELAGLLDGHDAIVDGEIVTCKTPGVPSFSLLQRRMNLASPSEIARLRHEIPVEYYAFDLLELDGISLLGKRYEDRRRLLDAAGLESDRCSVPPPLPGTAQEALQDSRSRRIEGIVAKRKDSVYRPGKRSGHWIKVKNFNDLEVVIGGYKPGNGARNGTLGSLLVGVSDGAGGLRYAGKVGTGFDAATLDLLMERLTPLVRRTSPFSDVIPAPDRKDAVWVEPVLVGEISFVEWTDTDRIRASSWRGLRPDKDVKELLGAGGRR
jgi:bifunctional non-homologous end joining protein LigD